MFTPRPRESETVRSPSGRDVEYETLPPSAIPNRLDPSKRMELEAEMVAVQEKILKTQKLLPDTMKWDGKYDTLDSFESAMGEWIEIRLGERALKAFQGEQMDAGVGGPSMPSCIYATWSQELYLLVRGRSAPRCCGSRRARSPPARRRGGPAPACECCSPHRRSACGRAAGRGQSTRRAAACAQ